MSRIYHKIDIKDGKKVGSIFFPSFNCGIIYYCTLSVTMIIADYAGAQLFSYN